MDFETEKLKEALRDAYREPLWIPDSGLDGDALRAGTEKILSREGVPFADVKADFLCFLLENARVAYRTGQRFLDRVDGEDLAEKLLADRNAWLKRRCAGILRENEGLIKSRAASPSADFGHLAPDWDRVLTLGIPGILEDLKAKAASQTDPDKRAFFARSVRVYGSMKVCLERMARCAETLTGENSPEAGDLLSLSRGAPRTMAQAMQLTLFFYRVQSLLETAKIRSLGGLDRLYYPFYKHDLESGIASEAQLRDLIRRFYLQISAMEVIANTPFYVCGRLPDGGDATNPLTYILLEEYAALDIYDPKIHVLYHDGLDPELIRMILKMIRSGKNSVLFLNLDAAVSALEKVGVEPGDARRVIVYGCYEPAAEGTEIPATCGGRINLAKALEYALYDGTDPVTGYRAGLGTGSVFTDFDAFFDAVKKQIRFIADRCMSVISAFEPYYSDVCPAPILSGAFESCLERGRDVFDGGAKYNNTSVVCAGFATLADSLVVIKDLVYTQKKISLSELGELLKKNWEGGEDLRLSCLKDFAKFGNSQPEADRIAGEIFALLAGCVNNRPNGRGGVFRLGLFSIDWRFAMGERTGATPDGRRRGETLSKNLCPSPGQDKNGVTAYLNSLRCVDSTEVPDGYVADVTLHCSAVRGEDGLAAFAALLKTFMKRKGFSVHFNVLDPGTLKAAQAQPEKYPNLQVRLCGWNVRFIDLTKAEQDEFILQAH